MRCPSFVRRSPPALHLLRRSDHDRLLWNCTNARMTCSLVPAGLCARCLILLRGSLFRGPWCFRVPSSPVFSSSPSVSSFSLNGEGAGCSVPHSGALPTVCSVASDQFPWCACISHSGETVSSGTSIPWYPPPGMGVSLRYSITFSTRPSMYFSAANCPWFLSAASLLPPCRPLSSVMWRIIPRTSRMITAPIPPGAPVLLLSVFVMGSRIAGCMSGWTIRTCSPDDVSCDVWRFPRLEAVSFLHRFR